MCVSDEAVQTAKSYIEYLYTDYLVEGKRQKYCHRILCECSDIDSAKKDDNCWLGFIETGTYLRYCGRKIKLYEHDCSQNEKLIQSAKTNYHLFDDLKKQIAFELQNGYKLAPLIQLFVAGVLSGDIQTPKKQTKVPDIERKYVFLMAAEQVRLQHKLKLTRNDVSPPKSALDAVSKALELLGIQVSYGTLKKDVYPLRNSPEFISFYEKEIYSL